MNIQKSSGSQNTTFDCKIGIRLTSLLEVIFFVKPLISGRYAAPTLCFNHKTEICETTNWYGASPQQLPIN
jgi:hypothetical protein